MRIDDFDTDSKVMIVAEIGNNHEGDADLAHELVRRAAAAGADAVKFQTFLPEHYVRREDVARLERLRKFALSSATLRSLADLAKNLGVLFISTPFDLQSARLLATLCPALKISSGDNTFYPLLEEVARFGKPLILSAGLAELAELRYALALIERRGQAAGRTPEVAVLHCVSSYPVPTEQANLGAIASLRRELNCTIGYSDHCEGSLAALLAVGAGARIIEKHFTIDKNYSDFRDHQLSATPDELAEMVRRIREAEAMMGSGDKSVQASEAENLQAMRRSVAAARDLPGGHVLTLEDLTWVRPGGGVAPGDEPLLLGGRLTRAFAQGEQITTAAITQLAGE